MSKWEYAVLTDSYVQDQDGWKRIISFYGPDGKQNTLDENSSGALPHLNQLGSMGWELVHISVSMAQLFGKPYQGAQPTVANFWLKRPTL